MDFLLLPDLSSNVNDLTIVHHKENATYPELSLRSNPENEIFAATVNAETHPSTTIPTLILVQTFLFVFWWCRWLGICDGTMCDGGCEADGCEMKGKGNREIEGERGCEAKGKRKQFGAVVRRRENKEKESNLGLLLILPQL
ncbi:hypothetical protein WN943_011487 [Citrus x changshan-huyou]